MYSSHTPFPKFRHVPSINKTCLAGDINSMNLLVYLFFRVFVTSFYSNYSKVSTISKHLSYVFYLQVHWSHWAWCRSWGSLSGRTSDSETWRIHQEHRRPRVRARSGLDSYHPPPGAICRQVTRLLMVRRVLGQYS